MKMNKTALMAFLIIGMLGGALAASAPSQSWNVGISGANGVDVADGVAYVSGDAGLTAVDISNKSDLWSVGVSGSGRSVQVVDGVAYVPESFGGLAAVDTNTESKLWSVSTNAGFDVDVVDGIAYVADGDAGLVAIDTSTDSELWSVGINGSEGVDVADGVAYVSGDAGLTAVDTNTESKLWSVGSNDFSTDVDVADGVAYVSNRNGLAAVDTNTESKLWTNTEMTFPTSVQVVDGIAYVTENYGLTAIDTNTESKLWTSDTDGDAKAVDKVGNTWYVADGDAGLTAFSQNSPPSASFTSDSPVNPGEDFGLDATGSSDPDGDVLSYDWDTDNDGNFDDATGVSPSVSKSELGTYTVRLRVTDSSGASDTKEITQFVEDSLPPTTTDDYSLNGWQERDSATIELSASDDVSEVDSISYRVNGGSFTEVSGDSATVEIWASGNNTLEYFATDSEGNEESVNTEYVAMYSSDDDSSGRSVDDSEETSSETPVQSVIDSIKSFIGSILSVVG